jgi:Ca2+-binding RTX toxin-like protein
VTFGANANVTEFEQINLPNHTAGVTLNLDAANIPANRTFIVSGTSNAGLDANGGVLATALTISAAAFGANQAASITGGSGQDTITGGAGNDIIDGGTGNDTIVAGAGNDNITGGGGNDTVTMATNLTSNDTVTGGAGVADTITVTNPAAVAASMFDRVTGFETITYTPVTAADANAQRALNQITVTASSSFAADTTARVINQAANFASTYDFTNVTAGSVSVTGGTTADVITGSNTLADTLVSGGGADTINGGGGNDTISTGAAAAAATNFSGGNGDDTFVMGVTMLTAAIIDGGAGTDTIQFTDATTTTTDIDNVTNVEVITLGAAVTEIVGVDANVAAGASLTINGAAATTLNYSTTETNGTLSIVGSAGVDTIIGGDGADTINGGAGSDVTIAGGAGNDSLTGGEGSDTIIGGTGADIIVLTETTSVADTVRFSEGGTGNVDTVSGFVVGSDLIAMSFTALTLVGSQIPAGTNATWTGTIGADVAAGTVQVFVNAAANSGTVNASAVNGVVKLTTGATSFAAALGTTSITLGTDNNAVGTIVAVGEVILTTWYDTASGQMVIGFVNSAADGTVGNITQNDIFVEVVRVGMTSSDYANFAITGLPGF